MKVCQNVALALNLEAFGLMRSQVNV